MINLKIPNKQDFVRVNFTNRGFAKILGNKDSVTGDTPNKENITNIANILANIKISKDQPITVKTIPEFVGIDYIGYIVEKERLNKSTGEWNRIDEYKIIGSEASSFVDTRIAYGHSYRYRIKSILKVTKSQKKSGLANLDSIENINVFEIDNIKKALETNRDVLQNIDKFTNLGLSSKLSSGITKKDIPLFGGISVSADESSTDVLKKKTSISEDYRILKNLRVENLNFAQGSADDVELQKLINKNLENFKEQKIEYYSAYYESNPSKNWIYVDVVENVPPPPPQTIKIVPNSSKKEIMISWLKPANSQRDIKYFRLYKRSFLGERWLLVNQNREISVNEDGFLENFIDYKDFLFSGNTNLFIDKNVDFGKKYVYALACVDVHDIESFLSIQIGVELNSNYILEKEEKPLKWISGSGLKPSEINSVIKKFFNQTEQIIAKKNIFISPTTKFAETQKDLIIKIKSLDTHEIKELKIILRNSNMKET